MFRFISPDLFFRIKLLLKGHRRLILFSVLFVVLFVYSIYIFAPISFSFKSDYVKTSSLDICINNRLSQYSAKLSKIDAVTYSENNGYLPFIGNGYYGLNTNSNEYLLLQKGQSLSLQTNLSFVFGLTVYNYFHKGQQLLDFTNGKIVKFDCFKEHFQVSLCIAITATNVAHRTRPELFIQQIKAHNPTKAAVQIQLNQNLKENNEIRKIKKIKFGKRKYELYRQRIRTSLNSKSECIVVIAVPVIDTYLTVGRKGDVILDLISGVKYKEITLKEEKNLENITNVLVNELVQVLNESFKVSMSELLMEHEVVWQELWKTGITIEKSLAPGALNGQEINSTMYYLLSHSEEYSKLKDSSDNDKKSYSSYLEQSSHCFNSHDTLYAKNLWSIVTKQTEMLSMINQWHILLRKNGCGRLMKAGASGLIQAIVRSGGAFKFAGDHMSFGMHPSDLQRPLIFRNIQYRGPQFPHFRVSVNIDDEYRSRMWVSLEYGADSSNKLFACDAACENPILLKPGAKPIELPVKITKPRYPLMYVSHNMNHLRDIPHVIHIERISDARAHDHNLIALHRHGNASSWAGLPPLFWVCVILLVLIFHLFLCRVIYTEYCRYKDDYDLSMTSSNREYNRKNFYRSRSGGSDYLYIPSTRRSNFSTTSHYDVSGGYH